MLFVLPVQTVLAEEHIALLSVGALDAGPGRPALAPLVSTGLTVLIPWLVPGDDARILDPLLRFNDLFQGDTVLNPVPKVVHILEFVAGFQPQAGDVHFSPTPLTKGIHLPYVHLSEPLALPTPNQLPKAPQVVEDIVLKGMAQNGVEFGQGLLSLDLDGAPQPCALPKGSLETVHPAALSGGKGGLGHWLFLI
jgi:hypothetical protein